MVHASRKQLTRIARQKIEVAQLIGDGSVPCTRPQVASYLVHVALECVLKARILLINKSEDTYQLLTRTPADTVESLFRGKSGHDLGALAAKSGLERLLAADQNEAILRGTAWLRLIGANRPYSIRYGAESLAGADATAEVDVAVRVFSIVERSLV